MKANIHPQLHKTHYKCSCGSEFHIESTIKGEVKIEICSSCHPLYTGQSRTIDTEGRIERFHKKYKGLNK